MNMIDSNHFCLNCYAVTEDEFNKQKRAEIDEKMIKKVDKLFQCSQCHRATYCSKECQRKDWQKHKPVCLTMRQSIPKEEQKTDPHQFQLEMESEVKRWRGQRKIEAESPIYKIIPFRERKEWWGAFAERGPSCGLIPLLSNVVTDTAGKVALDIGCGSSASALYLLEKGWRVMGVDYSKKALTAFEKIVSQVNQQWLSTQQLTLVCSPIENYQWPSDVDLVLAGSSLPYFDPGKMQTIMEKVYHSLKPGGHFVGNFFATKYIYSAQEQDIEREMGAWFVKDESRVRDLLINKGYDVMTCEYGGQQNPQSIVFIGRKNNPSALNNLNK